MTEKARASISVTKGTWTKVVVESLVADLISILPDTKAPRPDSPTTIHDFGGYTRDTIAIDFASLVVPDSGPNAPVQLFRGCFTT